jgi:ribosome-binding factor A
MREFTRTDRVGPELQRGLVEILREEVRDPRLKGITVQEVRVTRDLSHAKVYFTCFPLDEGGVEQQRLLNGPLAAFLRSSLSRRTLLRSVPQLHFVHDESVMRGEHLAHLIDQAVAGQSELPETSAQSTQEQEGLDVAGDHPANGPGAGRNEHGA